MRMVSLMLLIACGDEVTKSPEDPVTGDIQVDSDGDGFLASEDCDDSNSTINPNAEEVCDGLDNDCDNQADEDVQQEFFADSDNDGFGSSSITIEACEVPNGFVTNGSDCDDTDSTSFPGGEEVCDERDNDCNGQVDDNLGQSFYVDLDGDGYGNPDQLQEACFLDFGLSTLAGDCDDQNPSINPGGEEICNEIDDNCDGNVDEDVSVPYYADLDGDDYGDGGNILYACSLPDGYVQNTLDCNDSDSQINPAADEYCDSIDNDCDGELDEQSAINGEYFYEDNDNDGFGNAGSVISACTLPDGYVTDNTDCDDNNAVVRPESSEFCNGYDDNCDGIVDEEGALGTITYYPDTDGDGYGHQDGNGFCAQPEGFVLTNTDCDDNDNDIYPSSIELCNGEDDDCDGEIDEEVLQVYYIDEDGDGYGHPNEEVQTEACTIPSGFSEFSTDCDDTTDTKFPGNEEVCDDIDNDCDEETDEGVLLTFYADTDEDGYGDPSQSQLACEVPEGMVDNDEDCDDQQSLAYPNLAETCDSIDNNCDGQTDEGVLTTYYADTDIDTFGDENMPQDACSAPDGYVENSDDCNDSNNLISPNAAEICNDLDDDCNGFVDEGENIPFIVYYADTDEDGYGDPDESANFCSTPEGYVTNNLDCDDNDDDVNINGIEICNDEDDDCNGSIDDDAVNATTWYEDQDGDGFAGNESSVLSCEMPDGYFTYFDDCNDDVDDGFDINPDATEVWYDGVDQNCDGSNDYDQDGDGELSSDYGGDDCYDDDDTTTEKCGLYDFESHIFTSCGTTGRNGPIYSDCLSAYNTQGNWHIDNEYYGMFTQGIQIWTVPKTGDYRITAQGASGFAVSNSMTNSYGALQQATIELELGEKLLLLVGQMGNGNSTHGNENGGGGGSFVVKDNNYMVTSLISDLEILLVAGGGGGSPSTSYGTSCSRTTGNAQLSTSGKTVSCYGTGAGGTNGNGGSSYSVSASYAGGGGGGMYTNGQSGWTHCTAQPEGGKAFVNGGQGGFGYTCYSPGPEGGFGGGGAGGLGSPGGGGGYSGGGSSGYWSSYSDYGGGGGSYITPNSTSITSQLATSIGDGVIKIEFIE